MPYSVQAEESEDHSAVSKTYEDRKDALVTAVKWGSEAGRSRSSATVGSTPRRNWPSRSSTTNDPDLFHECGDQHPSHRYPDGRLVDKSYLWLWPNSQARCTIIDST
jgi:hypothetical protein